MNDRWVDYVLREGGSFAGFLADEERRARPTLLIMGQGFDPRTMTALSALADQRGLKGLRVIRLDLPAPASGGLEEELAERNGRDFEALMNQSGTPHVDVPWPEVTDPSSAGRQIIRNLIEGGHLNDVNQVLVDISALPRSVYFPVLGGLLRVSDDGEFDGDIHALVCDNPALDDVILEEGAEGAATLGGFAGGLEEARSARDQPLVWAPLLGPATGAQLESLLEYLDPEEICPVLPFPAANPRRADDLLLEYREFLFSEEVDAAARNFIYADESNPFDLYRTLGELQRRYRTALAPLGPTTVVLSAHSSKLLSIGVLLAAYEHGLPVVHVFPTRYFIRPETDIEQAADESKLTDVWLAGEPYR